MASEPRQVRPPGFTAVLRTRSSLLDAALICAVPVVLLWVFSLPTGVREAYVLDYTDPTLPTMYASNFVHRSASHLWTNLLGYAVIVPTAYLLCLFGDRRALFRVAFPSFLLVLPVCLSALNLVLFRQSVGFGFSGVVMGYFGLLTVALFGYLGHRTDADVGARHSPILFFVGIVIIAVSIAPATRASIAVSAAALAACLLYWRYLPGAGRLLGRSGELLGGTRPGYAELGAVGLLLFVSYPFIAFPADPFRGGTVVNLYTHLLGYALGFTSAYAIQMLPGNGVD